MPETKGEKPPRRFAEVCEQWISSKDGKHRLSLYCRGLGVTTNVFHLALTGKGRGITLRLLKDLNYQGSIAELSWNRALCGRHLEVVASASKDGTVFMNLRSIWGKFAAELDHVEEWEARQAEAADDSGNGE